MKKIRLNFKHITLSIIVLLFTANVASAQRFAFVDTEYILDNIAEYKAAQQQLDQLSVQWQKEIEDKYAVIDKLYKAYQAEQILLTEEMKRKREDEIIGKEKEVKEYQKQRFGYEGELFKKKQELVKPIQDKIYEAVKNMAVGQNYAIIFDKSGSLTMLFANPKYDKSDEILTKMGYKSGTSEGEGSGSTGGGSTGGGADKDGQIDRK